MNYEEKAKELAKLTNPKLAKYPNLSAVYDYGLDCAMKMAEWKEQQMLEKAVEWLRLNADNYTWYDETEGESGMMSVFIEAFIKAMKGE